ncbi:MAG: hypothetical protein AVDCRST_MAG88-965 [uncultured Thermomicrobiales bacterium]|uniref:Haloacid dehalogenase, type II n=1 Tax=uncultured Thermomicrobiales bacterium TaxID=1645740 RepID=A0A6J4UNE0_9BACT|nr:MAG: hypothetical protein AVDCRST_MAG88-965 [uncultured Thermomicrobiales bacterium]
MAHELLGLRADETMMVAAHPDDLRAARAAGLRTAYVPRPLEHGPDAPPGEQGELSAFDLVAIDFVELAQQLGA